MTYDRIFSCLTYLLCALTAFLVLSCGPDMSTESWPPDLYVAGIPVAGDVLPDEEDALSRLAGAIQALGYSLHGCPTVIFVRSPDQHIPEMCGSDGCCDIWAECPDALGTQERVEGEGFSGLQRGNHIFISRIGDRVNKLDSLLCHEAAHWLCDCDDGPTAKALERKLMEEM